MKSIPFSSIAIRSLVFSAVVATARAQTDLELPGVSQEALVKQRVGVTDITISSPTSR